MQNTIDLRKNQPASARDSKPEQSPPRRETAVPEEQTEALLSWTAPEFEARSYSTRWFAVMVGFALLCVIAAIIAKNYFFLAFIALAFIVIVMYAKQPPRDILFAIAKEGVYIGRKVFSWKALKSFALIEKIGQNELSLETEKMLMPYIRIPLPETDTEALRTFLKKFIPESEHHESAADEIGRNLGF